MKCKSDKPRSFTLFQLVVTVFVMAVLIRVAFHEPARPMPRVIQTDGNAMKFKHDGKLRRNLMPTQRAIAPQDDAAMIAGIPWTHRQPGISGQGPLLARAIYHARNLPPSAQQIDNVVQTLPPGEGQRVIIIPSVEKPEPNEVDKCAPEHAPQDGETPETAEADETAGAEACAPGKAS